MLGVIEPLPPQLNRAKELIGLLFTLHDHGFDRARRGASDAYSKHIQELGPTLLSMTLSR